MVRCLPLIATEPTSSHRLARPEARPRHPRPRPESARWSRITTDFCGEIVAVDRDLDTVTLEDRRRTRRTFPLGPGFLIDGKPVVLTRPTRRGAPAKPTRTASGSVAVDGVKARVARASRIFVEGRHDAELVEKVWGDDLRIEGVVVEYLGGVDDLSDHLRDFKPGPDPARSASSSTTWSRGQGEPDRPGHRPLGGRQARADRRTPVHRHLGRGEAAAPLLRALADVPRTIEWKYGVCQQLGWPHRNQTDIARAWQHILGGVRSFQASTRHCSAGSRG